MSHDTAARGLLRPLLPRDPHESHRVASPLELLTDLCFVVAIAQAAAEFHHAVSSHHVAHGLVSFVMVFFAIWWAWVNFSWFGSAYDNDDVIYRVLTIFQIVGSLVLAAGIHRMFDGDFTLGVTGYLIMRFALVIQWLRAARHDEKRRVTCLRYAVGIVLVQVGWVGYLWVPHQWGLLGFAVLGFAEFWVPVYAERASLTPWHPHHISERYSLLFLIVLGETILSVTVAIQEALSANQSNAQLLFVVVGGVLIVFSCWWLYFMRDAAELLERALREKTHTPYAWGFGHYPVFASAAALGAGLAARVDFWTAKEPLEATTTAAMVTVSTAVLLAALWFVQIREHDASLRTVGPFGLTIGLILVGTFTPVPELLTGILCVALVAVSLKLEARTA